jgi:hypothetical protein
MEHALTSREPKTCYPVGRHFRPVEFLNLLPDPKDTGRHKAPERPSMVSLALSGPDNPELVEWPEAVRPERRAFLAALLQDGATCYARNVHEEFAVARLDGQVLPLVVNHGGSSSC